MVKKIRCGTPMYQTQLYMSKNNDDKLDISRPSMALFNPLVLITRYRFELFI